MSSSFHLAIPAGDLEKAEAFYTNILGCKTGNREKGKWVDVDFWGRALDTKHGDYWEEFVDFPPKEIAYSVPEEGKFLITDPRHIRGVFDSLPNRLTLHYDVWHYKPKNLNRVGISTEIFDCRFYKHTGYAPVDYLGKTKQGKMNLWDKTFTKHQPISYNSGETWKVIQ